MLIKYNSRPSLKQVRIISIFSKIYYVLFIFSVLKICLYVTISINEINVENIIGNHREVLVCISSSIISNLNHKIKEVRNVRIRHEIS